jgi:hypothetical protein
VFEPRARAPDDVIAPEVMSPVFREVEKRLVDEAVVEKKLVLVALVEVEFVDVSRERVDEATTRRPRVVVGVRAPEESITKSRNCELKYVADVVEKARPCEEK